MSKDRNNLSADIFKSFSHKAKMNLGDANDEILLKEIQDITKRIQLEKGDDKPKAFGERKLCLEQLRDDICLVSNSAWTKGAKETSAGFICVSKIVDGKDQG